MTYTEIFSKIDNINNSTIINYFATINREEFVETAALFIENGELLAPFEKPIIGRKAIASYISQEAKGMKLLPKQEICESTEDNTERVEVIGKVKTSLFTVNVAWFFNLNQEQEIITVKIKLLASPQELLGLKQQSPQTTDIS